MNRKIGIIANIDKPRAGEALRSVASIASDLGVSLLADSATAALAGGGAHWVVSEPGEMAANADAIAVLGGDGTLLRAVHQVQAVNPSILLMGLNIGNLGYLTSVDESLFKDALEALVSGSCEISERQMLSCEVFRDGKAGASIAAGRPALNEIVLSRGSGRLVKIDLALNGQYVTTYACDGLIISTPTGSTAYSLSAGGPLVMPGAAATVITVICPHTLSSRPLVISDSAEISLRISASEAAMPLSIDGEEITTVSQGDTVVISKALTHARIAFLPGYSAYQVLARKLGWNSRGAN